jgi:hypothetical protein
MHLISLAKLYLCVWTLYSELLVNYHSTTYITWLDKRRHVTWYTYSPPPPARRVLVLGFNWYGISVVAWFVSLPFSRTCIHALTASSWYEQSMAWYTLGKVGWALRLFWIKTKLTHCGGKVKAICFSDRGGWRRGCGRLG